LSLLFEVVDASETSSLASSLLVRSVPPIVGNPGHTLREVDMNAVVIDQDIVHLEICSLAGLLVCVFDEGILQAVACGLVSDNLAAYYFPEL
jgi:hypothetical protein